MGKITVNNVGKAYKLYNSRFARFIEWISPFTKHKLKWILSDINFSIEPGEAVGVVGINGAGKSTLLKMITGTTRPTVGDVIVEGRIAALLELGMGFHPDFSGRQNVYMAGQLQGLSTEEIDSCFSEIENFADIGDYIDQPVRVYSSGMQVRLAFAVATAIRPDILIVDEALSVGDASFQRKCFRRIEEFQSKGTTLLFVTHDIESMKKICDKGLLLNKGKLSGFGDAKSIAEQYEKELFNIVHDTDTVEDTETVKEAETIEKVDPELISNCEIQYGDKRAEIKSLWLENINNKKTNVFDSKSNMKLKYKVEFHEDVENIIFSFLIKTKDGITLLGVDTSDCKVEHQKYKKGDIIEVEFDLKNTFYPDTYYINVGLRDDSEDSPTFLHRRVDALIFRIVNDEDTYVKSGLINTPVKFGLKRL
ncbi:ABC transporter ATP-binding protein [Vibrio sp. 10N.261.46.E11]|uniref:ABC transporter ATP-binding protein n=1 Tax=Vibrio sp. 10N.261.46.E11 TaxID=3229662 RepID=UPI00354B9D17